MIADTFYNSTGTGITDTEPLSCHTVNKCLTTGCTVERNVSDDNVFICRKMCILRRINNNFTTGKSFSKVVITVTAKFKSQSLRNKRTKALAACALAFYHIAVFCKAVLILSGNFCTKQSTKGTVDVADLNLDGFLFTFLKCRSELLKQYLFIQCLIEVKGVCLLLIKNCFGMVCNIRIVKDVGNIDVCGKSFQMLLFLKEIGTSHKLIHTANAELAHIFTQLLRDKSHKVNDIFRLSCKTLTKLGILGCNTNRTGIQVADTHHDTSHGYKRSGCKTEFFRTKDGCNGNITAAHQFSVCLDPDLVTKSVHNQGLMGFCKTKLPRKTGIVNGGLRSSTRTTVITGNQDDLCTGLGNTCCDRTNTCF